MLRWNKQQRAVLADKLADTANIAVGGLVFGQFVGERDFSIALVAVGIGTWLVLLGWSMFLARGNRI